MWLSVALCCRKETNAGDRKIEVIKGYDCGNEIFPMIEAIDYLICTQQPAVFICGGVGGEGRFKNVDFERLDQRMPRSVQNLAFRFLV